MPPALPADVIQQLESALKFQNLGQYNVSGADARHLPDKRAASKTDNNSNRVLVDTASAMNNLACCLSQDQSDSASKSSDSAYLLFKHARQVYVDAFGPAHPRVGLISRNLDRIQAFEFVAKPVKSSSSKSSKSGGKKKKKGAK
uniref:Uncharacterized protein n=1 Tax=Phytophthora ramorum TaxID=164328 RepID=H3HCZ9_PHYRM